MAMAQWHHGRVGVKHPLAASQSARVLVPQPLTKASVGSLYHQPMSHCWAQGRLATDLTTYSPTFTRGYLG